MRSFIRLALFGLLLLATTRADGRPRFGRRIDKRTRAA